MTLEALEASAELVDFGLQGSCLFELAARARRGERLIDDNGQGDYPLWAMDAGHHLRGDSSAAVPRAKRRAGHSGGADRLLEGYPTLFDGMTG
jgi:hypothetical protein